MNVVGKVMNFVFDTNVKPFLHVKNADDILAIVKKVTLTLWNALNGIHSILNFLIEIEENGKISFLDIMIVRWGSKLFTHCFWYIVKF